MNPWNSKPVTIELSDDPEKKLLDDNKVGVVKIIWNTAASVSWGFQRSVLKKCATAYVI